MDLSKFKNLKSPYILILVGPPLSGKGWFCNLFKQNINPDITIISRDQIVLDSYDGDNYNDAFNSVNQKKVDIILHQKMVDANKHGRNTIIDMTHMGSKRRRNNLSYFDDEYYKLAVIFPILSEEEYQKRNTKRIGDENKNISMKIVNNMISQYQSIREEEGFDKVVSL